MASIYMVKKTDFGVNNQLSEIKNTSLKQMLFKQECGSKKGL